MCYNDFDKRYSYYNDTETGFYYLQSRYYDPTIGRFISSDTFVSNGLGFIGFNMFAYCINNPVIFYDQEGCAPTAQVDINGDGEIDYYEYEYSITVIIDPEYGDSEIELSGTVYIFPTIESKPSFDNAPKPDGFNPKYDLMVGYYLDIDKKTGEKNPDLYAPQAHKTVWGVRTAMLECMLQYDNDFDTPWDRTIPSLQTEYTMHQIFSFDRSAQDIDFDNKEENFTVLDHIGKAIGRGAEKLWNLMWNLIK